MLWEILTTELSDVFDAHGVCLVAAQIIAEFTATTTVVAISDPLQTVYDIWVCSPGGKLEQVRWSNANGIFDRFLASAKPECFEKHAAPTGEVLRSEIWQLSQDSVLVAPLPYPFQVDHLTPPGIICLIDPRIDYPLTPQNLVPIATLITVYLDRAYLQRRSDQQQVEFSIISDISYSLTSTLDLNEIIQQVTDAVRRVLGTESLTIGLTDPTGQKIVFVEALVGPALRNMPTVTFDLGQGIAGWVAEHGEPAIVNDAYNDRRFSSRVDRDTGYLTKSVLCVPLKIEQKVIGVLEAINKQSGNFDENDSRLLQAISGTLAVAIENALLHTNALSEKHRVETIFAGMSDGLLTVTRNGLATAANDALLALLRLNRSQVLDQPVKEVVTTRPTSFGTFFERVLDGKGDFHQIACDLHQGQQHFLPVLVGGTTIPPSNDEAEELIFVFSDLSEIREIERMRDDFFNNIIHELRTPLATILMYARLLREGKAAGDQDKTNRFLGVIERESDRLQKMVWQMLQLVKLESSLGQGFSEASYLNQVLDQVLPPLADRAVEKGLLFRQHIPVGMPPVASSEESLYLIFKNLVENAIKFTPSGSVSVTARVDGDVICTEVKDDGIGIPKEAIPNLFQRFYRARTAVERGIAGTGLGLYMVKESLVAFGGSIEVDSTEGKGTVFTVYLPAAEG